MTTAIASPPLKRFLWKEYRMLRGLWLAVLVLGLLIDWLLSVLLAPPADFPAVRFCVALAAATLYAAGAAAVLFSVEHEEQTYDFLRGLPATWQPLFIGKLLIATVSAVALAAVLAILGFLPGRFQLPSNLDAQNAVSVLGLAIFEAVAWGTLCSLIFKRPLAAAMVTLVIGSLVTSTAVDAMNTSALPLSNPAAYATAIPLRFAIVVAVLCLSGIVARRWLDTETTTSDTSTVSLTKNRSPVRPWVDTLKWNTVTRFDPSRRFAMILRLVWQTWRESWKFLLVPVVLAAICLVIGLCGRQLHNAEFVHPVLFPIAAFSLFGCLLAAPALLGALAFTADQRRGGVRFLAEHAASPRIVWLSRHVVWLGALILLMTVVVVAAATLLTNLVHSHLREYQQIHDDFGPMVYDAREIRDDIATGVYAGATALKFLSCGVLAAYAIGQFCSMLLRSEILSAFTSLVLAVVLIVWIAALIAWGLSGWLFLLPLAIAFFGATWLRAPYWVAGRNAWRTWALPVTAIVGTLAVIGVMLPQIRLSEVRSIPFQIFSTAKATPASMAFLKKRKKEAFATADMYLKAANLLTAPIADSPLDRWEKPEFFSYGNNGVLGSIDVSKLSADQVHEFLTAKQKHNNLYFEQRENALKLAIEASQRPTCQFEFPVSPAKGSIRYSPYISLRLAPNQTYEAVSELLHELISTPTIEPPSDQSLAALRMNRHMMMYQPTAIVVRQLQSERQILAEIAKTLAAQERSNAERRAALEELHEFFRKDDLLSQTLIADLDVLRNVINGKEPPLILTLKPVGIGSQLAFVANELPWEHKRALIALEVITDQNLQNAQELNDSLSNALDRGGSLYMLRQYYRPFNVPAKWLTQQPAAATSYFASMEYQLRVPVNELFLEYCHTITTERANLLQIALAMFRADHKEYPPTLETLVPKYLEKLPLDPYSMGNFRYRAQGLEKPLQCSSNASEQIPAHTPLLWSVGPDNFQLQERMATNEYGQPITSNLAGAISELTTAPAREVESVYVLEPEQWSPSYYYYLGNANEFIFPLPK